MRHAVLCFHGDAMWWRTACPRRFSPQQLINGPDVCHVLWPAAVEVLPTEDAMWCVTDSAHHAPSYVKRTIVSSCASTATWLKRKWLRPGLTRTTEEHAASPRRGAGAKKWRSWIAMNTRGTQLWDEMGRKAASHTMLSRPLPSPPVVECQLLYLGRKQSPSFPRRGMCFSPDPPQSPHAADLLLVRLLQKKTKKKKERLLAIYFIKWHVLEATPAVSLNWFEPIVYLHM